MGAEPSLPGLVLPSTVVELVPQVAAQVCASSMQYPSTQRRELTTDAPQSQAIEGHESSAAHCCEVAPSGAAPPFPEVPTPLVPALQATTKRRADSDTAITALVPDVMPGFGRGTRSGIQAVERLLAEDRSKPPKFILPGVKRTMLGVGRALRRARARAGLTFDRAALNLRRRWPFSWTGEATMADPEHPPLHVLIADDCELTRALGSALLKRLGCVVTVAHDGLEACRAHQERPFDILFMDCEMPGMGGLDATREIRRQEHAAGSRRVAIVALTASARASDRAACAEAGMDDLVEKPCRREDLRLALLRHVTKLEEER